MKICIVGLSHKTAPVEVREKIAFNSPQKLEEALHLLRQDGGVDEAVILSTCNRVELYLAAGNGVDWKSVVVDRIARYHGLDRTQFEQSLYFKEGHDAVRHLFRVCSGLESMVLGEPQITGQIKEAYGFAAGKGTTGFLMNRLMHNAFSTAKRVRTETRIGSFAVSISYAAVELAKKIFDRLDDKQAMLIGAGEMAELAAKHLLNEGVSKIVVANRTFERACSLAEELKAEPCSFEEFPARLADVDIVISSTGAPAFIITPDKVRDTLRQRKNRPMFLIDIAVPRDIDPAVNDLDNVYVYDIDDLQNVVDSNLSERQKEAVAADGIVDEEVAAFEGWVRTLDVKPLLLALRRKAGEIREREVAAARSRLPHLSDADFKVIDAMANSIASKLLHGPTVFLKDATAGEDSYIFLDALQRMFDIHPEAPRDEDR